MNKTFSIRNQYQPSQPSVSQHGGQVIYREFLPDEKLLPFIYCYWQLQTTQPLAEPFVYRVVADGCIDIYFDLNDPSENYVMGFCKKFVEFPLANQFNYVGIRFLPTMFPLLFKIDAKELRDKYTSLQNAHIHTAKFIENKFTPTSTQNDIKTLLDDYFIKLLSQSDINFDSRLINALEIILKNFGVVNIENDLDTGISSRQLRRLFEFYIGDTAKTFAKVVRFQNILKAKPSAQSLKQNKLFFDVGYYDQAHFVKEFKTLYGVTPTKAFGR